MKKESLAKRIEKYLHACGNVWVSGDTIEKKAQEAGYKASYGAREARKLAKRGIIKRNDTPEGYVEYSRNDTKIKKVRYVPIVVDGITKMKEEIYYG